MKKIVATLLLFMSFIGYSQTNGITYQAVILNPSGDQLPGVNNTNAPLANKYICLKFSIIDQNTQFEYIETIQTTTDEFGMVNLVIGTGDQIGGYASSFSTILWNANPKSLKVDLSTTGVCSYYTEISNQPFTAVPFALYAVNSESAAALTALQATVAANAAATTNALALKEDAINKSTTTTLGTSNVLFPTQNAVKTYVDSNITTVNATVVANATAATNAIAAVQADVNQNEADSDAADVVLQNNITTLQNTVTSNAAANTTALATKEDAANKSTTTTLGTSNVLFPTQNAVKTYVDTNITSVNASNTALQATVAANAAATTTALGLKEDAANKSNAALGTSTTLFPTQNAVKTYVDAQISSATIADANATTKGKIQLAGDLGGTAAAPTVPGLANKENSTNKSTVTTLGNSDVLFPTQNAVKTYVDAQISSATIADADATTKGKIQLAGDLTGTAASPVIANNAITTSKILDANVTDAKIVTVSGSKVTGNITGSAASVTGVVPVSNGGTGQTTIPAVKSILGLSGTKVAIGADAGLTSQGNDAIAIGYNAGVTNQGASSIAIGYLAGGTATQGNSSIAIGPISGGGGNQSVAIGLAAWTGANNATAVGTLAAAGHVNSSAIGYQAVTTSPNTIQLGADGVTVQGSTAITNVRTSGTLTAGAVTYPNTHGSSGQVLSTTGNGTLTWVAPTASSLSGTVAVVNGGTGATTATGALTNLGAAPIASPTFTGTVTAPIYASTPQALTDAATIDWNPTNGLNASVTLGGNRTLSFSATPAVGSYGTLVVTQDATGGRTITLPSTSNKVLGSSSTTTIALSSAANAKDILNFYYDGTNCYWNIGQGYGTATPAVITNLASGVSGTLPVANGGSGAATLTGYIKGNGTSAMTANASIPVADVTGAAPIASPTFTGTPIAPTANAGTNTTQIATTEFVTGAVASATITDATTIAKGKLQLAGDLAGTADAPTVPGLALKAPIASPTFTGTVTAPIYASTPQSLTDTATIAWNPLNGLNASVTLGGNRTLSFSSMPAIGSYGTLVVTQDATGGRTITLPSTSNKVLGSTSTTTIALSSAANAKDILNFYYDGTNCYWNIGQGYGTAATTNVGSSVSGTLPVANGGSGAATLTGYIKGNGTSAMTANANIPVADVTGAAPIASPTFTGTPIAPTATAGTNTTQIATTEFVTGAVASATITDATTIAKGKLQLAGDLAGTADAPTVPGLALKAPIASPTFTGTVTAPIFASTPQALTDAATISWNPANGLNASVTLGGNRTLSFSSMPIIGSYGTLVVTQDATGGRTITLPSTSNKVLGSTSTTTITLSSAANAKDILNFYYDGTNCYWNIGQGYGTATPAVITNLASGVSGTLPVANGGSGAATLTGYIKGNGTSAMTANASIPVADVTGAAPLASPTFTGTPVAPTASAGTNTTQVATTEFVTGAVASATITDATTIAKGKLQLAGDLAGTADAPTVPGLALKAPIASPTFTGTVTAPIYASTPQALTDAATIDWNPTNGLNASVTLGGNRTLSFSSMPIIGSYGTLVVTQDATGGRTITLPSTSNKVLGSTSTTTITLSSAANAKDILNFYYDGTNCYWNIGQGYGTAATVASTNLASSVSGTLAVANGGTGSTTKTTAFDALSPMTTSGDIIYGGANGTGTRLSKGSNGSLLTMENDLPTWNTSIKATAGSTYNAPVGFSFIGGDWARNTGMFSDNPDAGGSATLKFRIATSNSNAFSYLEINPSKVSVLPTTASTSKTTGALTVAGGLGVDGNIYTNNLNASGTVTAGSVTYPNTHNSIAGQVLTTNATGIATWASAALPSKLEGTGFTGGLLVGHQTTGNITGAGAFQNTGVGIGALQAVSNSAIANTATGYESLQSLTSGQFNTAMGYRALKNVTTSLDNTAFGSQSLMLNTGAANTAIGNLSLQTNTTGNNNTAIGASADVSSVNLTNATAIGFNAKVATSNTIQLGNANVTNVQTSGTLTAGSVTYPNTHGTANQVLSSNGSGTLAWVTPVSSAASLTGTLAVANGGTGATTLTGYMKGNGASAMTASSTIPVSDVSGAAPIASPALTGTPTAPTATSGTNTTQLATTAFVTSAISTSGLPSQSGNNGKFLTTNGSSASWASSAGVPYSGASGAVNLGDYNLTVRGIKIGTSGTDNFALQNNMVIGKDALVNTTNGYNNMAIGNGTLYSNVGGYNNLAIGNESQYNNLWGWGNVSLGIATLNQNVIGNFNTAVGHGAGYFLTSSYNTAFGHNALDGQADGGGNTGVGVNAGGVPWNQRTYNSTFLGYNAKAQSGLDNVIVIGYNAYTNEHHTIQLGDSRIVKLKTSGTIWSNGSQLTSDARLKTNIQPLPNSIDLIMKLNPVHYTKKNSIESTDYAKTENGFIAQELQKVLPYLVIEGTDKDKILSVDYNSIIPVLTKGIQEQQLLIKAQQKQIDEMRLMLDKLIKDKK